MPSTPRIELVEITKWYGDCRANDGVNLRVEPGTIHGLVGENGAGKSTAMKFLFGMERPDSGTIRLDGREVRWRSSQDAIRAGIGMVHQHFMLAGPLSVLDNIVLGAESKFWKVGRAAARARLRPLVERYAPGLDLDSPVNRLPVGMQQKVEILKLLYRDSRVLILDEPTAVLTPQETEEFFGRLRELKAEGRSVIIITHKLAEVKAVTDSVTVLRAGKTVASFVTAQTTVAQLAEAMVGRAMDLDAIAREARPCAPGEIVAEMTGPMAMQVRAGEIVGIAGVDGNGQDILIEAMAAAGRGPGARRPVGWVPADRHAEALLMGREVAPNVLLGHSRSPRFLASRRWLGLQWIRPSALQAEVIRILERFDVRPRDPQQLARRFSGGNQQKIVMGRELGAQPKFLVIAQPTRGVDVGAIELIHREVLKARDGGAGILLVSSELDEVLALSDRVLVLYRGRVVGERKRGDFDRAWIGQKMGSG